MKSRISSMHMRSVVIIWVLLMLPACDGPKDNLSALPSGTVLLPLYTRGSLDSEFRLVNGEFVIAADSVEFVRTNSSDHLTDPAIVLNMATGAYEIALEDGWVLERLDGDVWMPVEATLTSENPLTVQIAEGQTTVATFSFLAGNEIVSDDGSIEIEIEVTECDSTLTLCGDACVDISSNIEHCGACGNTCATDETCANGVCIAEAICDNGFERCDDICVDILWNSDNCGTCGNNCASGGWCENGGCVCAEDFIVCDNTCVNQHWDNQNCGECGAVCATWCNNGTCAQ